MSVDAEALAAGGDAATAAREAAYDAGGDVPTAQRLGRATLRVCLDVGFRLLHPMMPFVTEELWQRLPGRGLPFSRAPGAAADPASIVIAPYPMPIASLARPDIEADFATFQTLVRAGRSLRADADIVPSKFATFFVLASDGATRNVAAAQALDIKTLLRANELTIVSSDVDIPEGCAATVVSDTLSVYIQLKGLVDPAAEIAKLDKKLVKLRKEMDDLRKRSSAPGFEEKVPAEVRVAMAEQLAAAEKQTVIIEGLQRQYASWKA
jgi:valyl-tRNA synthetase